MPDLPFVFLLNLQPKSLKIKSKRYTLFYLCSGLCCLLGYHLLVINSSGIIYGLAGAWCWIQNWQDNNASDKLHEGEIEQYVLLYIPAIICLLLSGVAVIMTIIAIMRRAYSCCGFKNDCSKEEQIERKKMLKVMLPLVSYPILSLVFYIPAFINRLIGSISTSPNFTSFMWSAISLHGRALGWSLSHYSHNYFEALISK